MADIDNRGAIDVELFHVKRVGQHWRDDEDESLEMGPMKLDEKSHCKHLVYVGAKVGQSTIISLAILYSVSFPLRFQ